MIDVDLLPNADKSAYPLHPQASAANELGLTKREMFAMAAMQGLCANSNPGAHHRFANLCNEAITYADELLRQLEA